MSAYKPINLRKTRDFGQKLNATIEFIRENFANLFKAILFIVGPVTLILAVVSNYYQTSLMSTIGVDYDPNSIDSLSYFNTLGTVGILFMFVGLLSHALVITVIYEYVVLYLKKQSNQITTAEVWEAVKKDVLMIMISVVVASIIITVGALFFVLPGIYLAVLLSLIYIVQINERKGFFAAMSRCGTIISGKWWSTFGLLFVTWTIAMVLAYAVMIPFSMISVFSMFTDLTDLSQGMIYEEPSSFRQLLTIVSSMVFSLFFYIMLMFPSISIAFQYFNLVERKESVGLMEKIGDFGAANQQLDDSDEEEDY